MSDDADPTKIVSARLEPDEIRRLDKVAAAESRHRSQQIAYFIRCGLREAERERTEPARG